MGENSCQPFGLRPNRLLTLSRGLLIFAISASPRFASSTVLARNAHSRHFMLRTLRWRSPRQEPSRAHALAAAAR